MKAIIARLRPTSKKDGQVQIVLCYGSARYGTTLYTRPEWWNKEERVIRRSDPAWAKKNMRLSVMLQLLEQEIVEPVSDHRFYEICDNLFGKKEPERKFFLAYLDEFMALKTKPGTIKIYSNTRKKLEAFDKTCVFESMNKGWLIRFEKYLSAESYSVNYISIILRAVRAVFNYCIDCEYTELYPFRRFQIKEEPTKKRALTIEQLRMLRDYEVQEHQEKYRDCFMLMFYLIGINIVDLFSLQESSIDAQGYITYKRMKTSKTYRIKLEPEATAIINKYKGKKHLLCWADEWRSENFKDHMNDGLKKIGPYVRRGLGGKKIYSPILPSDISGYWARHTWATVAAHLDISIDTISHALGHSDQAHHVTEIYIKYDTAKINAANRKVIDYLNND